MAKDRCSKKLILGTILVTLLIIAMVFAPDAEASISSSGSSKGTISSDVSVELKGKTIENKTSDDSIMFFIYENRLLVSEEFVGKYIKLDYEVNENSLAVKLSDSDFDVCLFIVNEQILLYNDYAEYMDVSSVKLAGKIYIPIRFLLEKTSYTIDWVDENRTVNITREKGT